MRKRLIYGLFVLTIAVVSGLLYYDMRNDAEQSNSHIIPSDLNSALSSPNNILESMQSEDVQVSVEDSLELLEDQELVQESKDQSDTTMEIPSNTPLRGRKVALKDGREIVVVDVPDSLMKKTKVRFDKEGKAHVSCH